MKNFILSLSVLAVMVLLTNCTGKDSKTFIDIPDTNFNSFLLGKFDTNKDGRISLSEAKAVKEIDCSNRNIEDLTGIEMFENLERLICSDNQLSELELRFNKKLNWLVCTHNADPLYIYFGKSSPLTNKNYVLPEANKVPNASASVNPIDVNKCIYDEDKVRLVILFDY